MKENKLNKNAIRLLRRVQKAILKDPKSYDQDSSWPYLERPTCKSPVCIIGWMRHFTKGNDLPLTQTQFDLLYMADQWPKKFFRGGHWSKIKASTAAKRIEHFIKTDGDK